jgi:hypothetical protein
VQAEVGNCFSHPPGLRCAGEKPARVSSGDRLAVGSACSGPKEIQSDMKDGGGRQGLILSRRLLGIKEGTYTLHDEGQGAGGSGRGRGTEGECVQSTYTVYTCVKIER